MMLLHNFLCRCVNDWCSYVIDWCPYVMLMADCLASSFWSSYCISNALYCCIVNGLMYYCIAVYFQCLILFPMPYCNFCDFFVVPMPYCVSNALLCIQCLILFSIPYRISNALFFFKFPMPYSVFNALLYFQCLILFSMPYA